MTTLYEGQSVRIEFALVDEDGTALDVSAATAVLVLKDAAGTVTTKSMTTTSNATAFYDTLAADLAGTGVWEYQGKITSGGKLYPTDIYQFNLAALLG